MAGATHRQPLVDMSHDRVEPERAGFGHITAGWAIGTAGRRTAAAADHWHFSPAIPPAEAAALNDAHLGTLLEAVLKCPRKPAVDIRSDRK